MNNETMMQYFEWYLFPDTLHWKKAAAQADKLSEAGFTALWLPPAYKGSSGVFDVGYAVYDTYDLGEFDQKNTIPTKYGSKDEYIEAIHKLQETGIKVYADIVLNHRIGADDLEQIEARKVNAKNRLQIESEEKLISAWTKFTFPGRKGQYSSFTYNWKHFDGSDWDDKSCEKAIYMFEGKNWETLVDGEYANYDYLMGADLDMSHPEVMNELLNWGKWYLDTTLVDGFRLDAVKHIRFTFFTEWLHELRVYTKKELFSFGEYWSGNVNDLQNYLHVCGYCMSLFDVPLHYHFYEASIGNGSYDMRNLLKDTLVQNQPVYAITFVDNHDTQPGQSLQSFVDAWFKPLAYAVILLREGGFPCVFYGDLYGIPHDKILPVALLPLLIYIRKHFAYGPQHDYFDHEHIVGWSREGDEEHNKSGLAVVLSDGLSGEKHMYIGTHYAGHDFRDISKSHSDPVTIQPDGTGVFPVGDGNLSIWLTWEAYEKTNNDI